MERRIAHDAVRLTGIALADASTGCMAGIRLIPRRAPSADVAPVSKMNFDEKIIVVSGLELIQVNKKATDYPWEYEIVNPKGKEVMGKGSGFTRAKGPDEEEKHSC